MFYAYDGVLIDSNFCYNATLIARVFKRKSHYGHHLSKSESAIQVCLLRLVVSAVPLCPHADIM